ncbi:hypothetical protein AVEN_3407-1 [Araneus ventricosus]|uniref:Uncharacterized protein n=1 Tax=Araneus ventricosus TaxID=182803 RepID=A0A4Y2KJL2_ARAVE|nr:hypothetical protein AVEN_3407-1 [Araneus ventricosus]
MLSDHAYSGAVRCHTLLLIAPSKIIFSEMNLPSEEQQFMDANLNDLHDAKHSFSTVEDLRIINVVKRKYQNKCFQLKERGPTSKLWVAVAVFRTGARGGRLVLRESRGASKSMQHTSQC